MPGQASVPRVRRAPGARPPLRVPRVDCVPTAPLSVWSVLGSAGLTWLRIRDNAGPPLDYITKVDEKNWINSDVRLHPGRVADGWTDPEEGRRAS